jgi:AraC family transcriptional regulator
VEDTYERPLRVVSRIDSENRGWDGFAAALVEVAGGTSETIVLARHNVTMLAGTALSTRVSCDDVAETRLQRPGTFDVLPAQSSVRWTDRGGSLFVVVGLDHRLIRETAHAMGIDSDCLAFAPNLTCRDVKIEYLLWALKAELEQEQPLGRIYADSVGIALASQLVRRWGRSAPRRMERGLSERGLKRVLAYIDERLAYDLTLEEIAGQAGFSASRFGALFKCSTGVPVHRYVIGRRVQRAVDLITRTRLPLSDVALQAGFANQSHMALTVRRSIGVTPKRLRDAC